MCSVQPVTARCQAEMAGVVKPAARRAPNSSKSTSIGRVWMASAKGDGVQRFVPSAVMKSTPDCANHAVCCETVPVMFAQSGSTPVASSQRLR